MEPELPTVIMIVVSLSRDYRDSLGPGSALGKGMGEGKECYGEIRRTVNSSPGPWRPHTMHISRYDTGIPRMWTDSEKKIPLYSS